MPLLVPRCSSQVKCVCVRACVRACVWLRRFNLDSLSGWVKTHVARMPDNRIPKGLVCCLPGCSPCMRSTTSVEGRESSTSLGSLSCKRLVQVCCGTQMLERGD